MACETAFAQKTTRLRAAASGKLHAELGKFSVGFIGVLVTGSVALVTIVPAFPIGLIGGVLLTGAVGFGFVVRWARTPPRKLIATQKIRHLRAKFLKKRAPMREGD